MLKEALKLVYGYFFIMLPSMWYSVLSRFPYKKGYKIRGRAIVKRPSFILRWLKFSNYGKLLIGENFSCNNKQTSNSIGLVQPFFFYAKNNNSTITIGNNVGMSGSSIVAFSKVTIGNNVMIGSGCLITDNDAHPIGEMERLINAEDSIGVKPVVIEDNCFIGARSIILKGVTIGKGSVIGAGSVVTKNVPPHTIACGNPAKVIKEIKK